MDSLEEKINGMISSAKSYLVNATEKLEEMNQRSFSLEEEIKGWKEEIVTLQKAKKTLGYK